LDNPRRQRPLFDRIVERKHPICVNDGFREASRVRQGTSHGAMPEHVRNLPSLFLGKGQDLRGALARYVAVERYHAGAKQSGQAENSSSGSSGGSPSASACSISMTRPLCDRLGFRRGLPFDMLEWIYQCNMKVDFFATKRWRAGQGRDLIKCMRELLDGLDQRGAR
jgi:hypothetical protein